MTCAVRGQAAHPSVLKQAEAQDAAMLGAGTQSNETNRVACQVAATRFNVPTRIRANDFLSQAAGINFAVHFLAFRQRSPVANRHPS